MPDTKVYAIKDMMHVPEIAEVVAKIQSGEIVMCACLGPRGSDPYCPCIMKREGIISKNPVEIIDYSGLEKWYAKNNE
jgi:hypothetical protein